MASIGLAHEMSRPGWRMASRAAAILLFLVVASPTIPAMAQTPVDLELVLAIDSSASVDNREFALQLRGLAHAFRDPELLEAIRSGPHQAISVTLIEWSSASRQRVNIPWRLVTGTQAAAKLADDLKNAPRLVETGATSISEAIRFSLRQFPDSGFVGFRRVVDISGDGENNQGVSLDRARRDADSAGVTVNALAVKHRIWALDAYFREEVITRSAAFAIQADNYEDYIEAVRRKLIREIRNTPVS
jgi:hypothetical protein